MLRLGLTGGIGSGKRTVAALLAKSGAEVVDADAIARNTTAANGPAMAAIAAEFGPTFLTSDKALDRERMRALVFQDATAKTRLEAIVHPLVRQQVQDAVKRFASGGVPCVVLDIPLLVESQHWRKQVDRVLVVDCSPPTQVVRVVARSGLREEEVRRIIASQASRQQRLRAADLVLHNDGMDMHELVQQVRGIGTQFGL